MLRNKFSIMHVLSSACAYRMNCNKRTFTELKELSDDDTLKTPFIQELMDAGFSAGKDFQSVAVAVPDDPEDRRTVFEEQNRIVNILLDTME